MTERHNIEASQEDIVTFALKLRVMTARLYRESFPTLTSKIVGLVVYIFLLAPSFLISALIWDAIAADKMFVCTDSVGFEFIPPFIHDCCGDHYVWPAAIVWMFWVSLVAASLIFPAAVVTLYSYHADRLSRTTQ